MFYPHDCLLINQDPFFFGQTSSAKVSKDYGPYSACIGVESRDSDGARPMESRRLDSPVDFRRRTSVALRFGTSSTFMMDFVYFIHIYIIILLAKGC